MVGTRTSNDNDNNIITEKNACAIHGKCKFALMGLGNELNPSDETLFLICETVIKVLPLHSHHHLRIQSTSIWHKEG
jgi:hypothetical protein